MKGRPSISLQIHIQLLLQSNPARGSIVARKCALHADYPQVGNRAACEAGRTFGIYCTAKHSLCHVH